MLSRSCHSSAVPRSSPAALITVPEAWATRLDVEAEAQPTRAITAAVSTVAEIVDRSMGFLVLISVRRNLAPLDTRARSVHLARGSPDSPHPVLETGVLRVNLREAHRHRTSPADITSERICERQLVHGWSHRRVECDRRLEVRYRRRKILVLHRHHTK